VQIKITKLPEEFDDSQPAKSWRLKGGGSLSNSLADYLDNNRDDDKRKMRKNNNQSNNDTSNQK
jgi:hypothetical protein